MKNQALAYRMSWKEKTEHISLISTMHIYNNQEDIMSIDLGLQINFSKELNSQVQNLKNEDWYYLKVAHTLTHQM